MIGIAGNVCMDLVVPDAASTEGTPRDGWGENVQLLDQPIESTMAGGGAAPAFLLGSLGRPVWLNTNLGRDVFGTILRERLESVGVELLSGRTLHHSAINVIRAYADGSRASNYYPGEKVDWLRSLEAETPDWFMASGFGLVDADDLAALHEVFAQFQKRGSRVAFDPSPWFAERVEIDEMTRLFARVDCLVATEEELRVWETGSGPEDLASNLVQKGPSLVVVKRGPEGASFASKEGKTGSVPTQALKSANTVGAGDAFNGQLLDGITRGIDAEQAVTEAVRTATRVARCGRGSVDARP